MPRSADAGDVPRLFHVSDAGPLSTMAPRPSPPGTQHEGRPLVWAVDDEHLAHYLLPRDCPRVCWLVPDVGPSLLASPARRVVAVEHAWAPRVADATVWVHELPRDGFTLLDAVAGYWVGERPVEVVTARRVTDCPAALAARGVELRPARTLWPYVDAAVAADAAFSAIRMRHAAPRD
ncbi:MAG TPA: hypothetical protein VF661_03675 [Actinomycetales bacterium]|jgi:hypothetical protein